MTTPKLAQQINSSQVGSVEVPYSLETLRKSRLQMGQRIAELSTENASLKQQLRAAESLLARTKSFICQTPVYPLNDWFEERDLILSNLADLGPLTDLTACLEWADKNVASLKNLGNSSALIGTWEVMGAKSWHRAPTLLQALTTAYENRDKTKE